MRSESSGRLTVSSTPKNVPGLPRLYGRAVSQGVLAALLPPAQGAASPDLGDLVASADRVPVSAERLARYRDVCGFLPGAAVPPTYPHVLAFPLHLMVMTRRDFPFPALGAIHVASRIVQERPLAAHDVLDLSVAAKGLRTHRRGHQITVVTQARVAREVIWHSENVFLHRERSTRPELAGSREETSEAPEGASSTADAMIGDPGGTGVIGPVSWNLPTELGRRYAAVSGDRNPIHLYDVTARPFGFPRHIAHGMWTVARALAQLADGLPERLRCDVEFRRPLRLPATVEFQAGAAEARITFEVSSTSDPSKAAATGRDTRGPSTPEGTEAGTTTHLIGSVSRL